jgi:hypothetical protein
MAGQNSPAMSLIFVADRYESIRETIDHIRRQTARDRLEVVIVVPSAEALEGSDLEAFRHVRIVELGGPLTSLSRARAAGIRRASAPVIALTETHSFPDRGWAEALIKAHQGPWAGVAPVVAPANPRGSLSRAVFVVGFGAWAAPVEAGPVEGLPGNNGSYKRDLLLGYGDRLDTMMMPEMTLQQELRSKGHRFCLEPAGENPPRQREPAALVGPAPLAHRTSHRRREGGGLGCLEAALVRRGRPAHSARAAAAHATHRPPSGAWRLLSRRPPGAGAGARRGVRRRADRLRVRRRKVRGEDDRHLHPSRRSRQTARSPLRRSARWLKGP